LRASLAGWLAGFVVLAGCGLIASCSAESDGNGNKSVIPEYQRESLEKAADVEELLQGKHEERMRQVDQ
jgi:hypothetical protein